MSFAKKLLARGVFFLIFDHVGLEIPDWWRWMSSE